MSEQREEPSVEGWAALLRGEWEARARSDSCDFYVASHAGWDDAERRRAQAEGDITMLLHALDPEALRVMHVLEIGSGVGRLAGPLAERTASYTGFDVAPGMVAEARRRHAGVSNVRFLQGDGLVVPKEARDRAYDLALSLAVFIHCPRAVTASLVRSAYALLAPGGELRFQLLADPDDPTGIVAAPATPEVHEQVREMEAGARPVERALIDGHYYMGDRFRYDDVEPFLLEQVGEPERAELRLARFDRAHVYGGLRRLP
ncbi:MAG: class I SAM-dependent methyltransferase [Planctomycetota bacterium]